MLKRLHGELVALHGPVNRIRIYLCSFVDFTILHVFWCLQIFFKIIFFLKKKIRNTIRVSNTLDPGQAQHFVGPDLGPNCLQRLSADNTNRQRVNMQRNKMRCVMGFPTMWYVRTVKPQIRLRICTV